MKHRGGTKQRRPMAAAILCVLGFVAACGCGRPTRTGLVEVNGTVTWDGHPLEKGGLVFGPTVNRGGGSAAIGSAGRFRIALDPGEYVVVVRCTDGPDSMDDQGNYIPAKSLIPEKYTDAKTSGLTLSVAPGIKPVEFVLVR
jgi:hypothetical protein